MTTRTVESPPRAIPLTRMTDMSLATLELRADDDEEQRPTLVGYPIVFNEWAEIAGWEGHFLEQIAPGALTKTLDETGDQIKVLFNHGFDVSGRMPLGRPEVMEVDKRGLYTETPLADTSFNADLIPLLEAGAIDGMSFQFTVQREEWVDEPRKTKHNPEKLPERIITEMRLFEFGPVTFPAYQATTAGVQGRDAYEAWLSAAHSGTLGLAVDTDAPPLRHPSVTSQDVARLQRAVTRSLKEHEDHGRTTRTTR